MYVGVDAIADSLGECLQEDVSQESVPIFSGMYKYNVLSLKT